MPDRLSRTDRTLLMGGGALFLLLVAVALFIARGAESTDENPTTYATGSSGAKAAYLLLGELGYRVARWEQPPRELTDASTTTLILAEPHEAAPAAERQALRQFIQNGGRVIATGVFGSALLATSSAPSPTGTTTWARAGAVAPSAMARAAAEITLNVPVFSKGGSADARAPVAAELPLYTYEDLPVVVVLQIGRGEAMWWASATPLTNAGLREPGNLEFFLASLGRPQDRRVLFDEYFHGARRSLAGTVLHSPVKWLLLQCAVVALVVLFTYSRRSGPIVVPAPETRLAPLEFVRTLGSLYERAGAASVAVDIVHRRFRFWLTRRLGVPNNLSADALELAVQQRWRSDARELARTLRACEAAHENSHLPAKDALALTQALAAEAAALELYSVSPKERV